MPEEKGFLKREEIRTMQKDIARLREIEAQKERERIAEMKAKKKEEIKIIPEKEESPIQKILPPPPKRPSFFEKIFIRAALVIIFILILSILIYQFGIEKPTPQVLPPEKPEIPPIETVTPPREEIIPEIVIPPALISIDQTETLEIRSSEEIPLKLSQLLKKDLGEDKFTRILIKDTKENKILGLKEFFQAFEVKTPENFYQKLNNDFTLFIYSSQKINRLGLVAKVVKKEDLFNLMKSWEKTLEKDFEKLLLTLGKTGPAPFSYFKTAHFKGQVFRYLSIPPENFGICWTKIEDYFIFTTSGQSMLKTIGKIYE